MTVGFGIGMFFYGMGCICIGAVIAYYIINKTQKTPEQIEQEEKKEQDEQEKQQVQEEQEQGDKEGLER